MNKIKIMALVAVAAVFCASPTYARGHHGGHGRYYGGGHHHHHHHGSAWGRGGRNFWPGFVGGMVAGALVNDILDPAPSVVVTPAPVVVTPPAPVVVTPAPAPVVVAPQPVYTTQSVWVEGCYVTQTQPNGAVIRVWQPGHYEQRPVLVQ